MRACERGNLLKRAFLILWLAIIGFGFGPCGYQRAGQGKALPDNIHTIAVQTFRNESVNYRVDQRFTQAVIDELLHRTSRFKLVSDAAHADALITGNIRNVALRHVLLDTNGRTRVFEVSITSAITIRDQTTNKILFDDPRLVFIGEYELSDDEGSFFNEQNPAVERIAKDFAKSVVSTMMEGF
jgi:hypothetical protein